MRVTNMEQACWAQELLPHFGVCPTRRQTISQVSAPMPQSPTALRFGYTVSSRNFNSHGQNSGLFESSVQKVIERSATLIFTYEVGDYSRRSGATRTLCQVRMSPFRGLRNDGLENVRRSRRLRIFCDDGQAGAQDCFSIIGRNRCGESL